MPSFHEFDVALTPGVVTPAASVRTPTNEVHLNPWVSGVKGTPSSIVGDAPSVGAALGITLASSRSVAQSNAPAELVLGDLSGAWVINIADLNMSSTLNTLFSGVFIS